MMTEDANLVFEDMLGSLRAELRTSNSELEAARKTISSLEDRISILDGDLNNAHDELTMTKQAFRNYQVLYGELITTAHLIKCACDSGVVNKKLVLDTLRPFFGGK